MKKNGHKYNVAPAQQRRWNGKVYDSKAEMLYAKRLSTLRAAGEIIEWAEQVRITLGVPENEYRADFLVIPTDAREAPHYVDVKGQETKAFKRTKKLWASYGHLDLHVIKRKGRTFETIEIVKGVG